jgi:hypothetical protein
MPIWGLPRIGGAGGPLSVAAANSSPAARQAATYLCDGVADDLELNAAYAALVAAGGGTLVLAPGAYNLAAVWNPTPAANTAIYVLGYGAILNLAAGITGVLLQGQSSGQRPCTFEGFRIAGTSTAANTAIEIRDTSWSRWVAVQADADAGILLNNSAAGRFCEGTALEDIVLRHSRTHGIEWRVGAGTNSFGQQSFRNVNVNVDAGDGVSEGNGASIYRSRLDIGVWIPDNLNGFVFSGDVANARLDLWVEGQTGSVNSTGIFLGSTFTGGDLWQCHYSWWGAVTFPFSNPSNLTAYYTNGRTFYGSATTSPLVAARDGDSSGRVILSTQGASGGRIILGNGAGTTDVTLDRAGALLMTSAAQFRPADIKSRVKAGTPVDGDITGGAADGDIVADSTGVKLWIRVGGLWKGVVVA